MSQFRFLLDENVDPPYRRQLLRREPEMAVRSMGEPGVPARGTPDPEMLLWCEEYSYTLVTNNRRSMPEHLASHLASGGHVLGVIQLNDKLTIGENLDDLLLHWGAATPEEYSDRVTYLPVTD
ncbi:MAG: DUF5615 family PIN-like protein [Armatimonadetes bacterium]|nr:DUF5615 family PIN-like protein [Armatimonadota bacterium]